jgi:hypothetical protein
VNSWISRYSDPATDEVRQVPLTPSRTLTVVSHDLAQSMSIGQKCFFKGSAVDYERGSVVFGLQGWLNYSQDQPMESQPLLEGQFLLADWNEDQLRFRRDVFGTSQLLYSSGPGYAIVSDSLLALVDFRRHVGDPCTLNDEVLLARSVFSGLGAQQISPETYVNQISFLPARLSLDVSFEREIVPDPVGSALQDMELPDDVDYAAVVRDGAVNLSRLIATLTGLPNWTLGLSLSGGYDSRVCLAGGIAAGVVKEMHFTCNSDLAVHAEDYRVAEALAERWGFSIRNRLVEEAYSSRREIDCTPFMLWSLSSMGVYDYFSMRQAARMPGKYIGLTGLGGELLGSNYSWQSWPDLAATLHAEPDIADALTEQGRKGVKAVGGDPESRLASELHFMNYRHALHGSRHVPLHMVGFAPLQQRLLTALAYSPRSDFIMPAYKALSPVNDLNILLAPELSTMPYDKPKKNLSKAYVEMRLERLGGPIDTAVLTPYTVHGLPDDVPAGPPEFLLNLARLRGLDLPQTAETLMELGEKGLDVLKDHPQRKVLEAVGENARWRLTKKKLPPIGAGESPAKLVSIYELFGESIPSS